MTVKELKKKLEQFPDNLIVMIPNSDIDEEQPFQMCNVPAKGVSRGVNEADGCLFIDSYEEDD